MLQVQLELEKKREEYERRMKRCDEIEAELKKKV